MKVQGCKVCGNELPIGRKRYCDGHRNERVAKQVEKEQSHIMAGLCKMCSNPLSENSAVFCDQHLVANRERGVKDRERRKQLGMCRSCSEPLSPKSKTWCETHRLQQNEQSRLASLAAREKEMCIDCDNIPRLPRKRRCEICQEVYETEKAKICRRIGCDAPIEVKHFCRVHADEENQKLSARRKSLLSSNKCIYCFKDKTLKEDEGYTLCHECRAKQRTQRASAGV